VISRFFHYCRRVFHLHELIDIVEDGRIDPDISAESVWLSMFLLFLLRTGSLNGMEEVLLDPARRSKWARILRGGPPSADAVGYFGERADCDSLRKVQHEIYTQLQRNRHIAKFRIGGWSALALDGHELFSSYDLHCEKCRTRTITTKKGPRTQYYHSIVAAHLVGGPIPLLLDAEPMLPGEDEIAAACRLLERVQKQYPKAYDVVTADAIYFDPRIISTVRRHGKHLIAVLKDDHPAVLAEAKNLCQQMQPITWKHRRKEYAWWDIEGILTSSNTENLVRVVRSQETKPSKTDMVTSNWFWMTTFSQGEAPTETVWCIGHKRWDIENNGFNYLVTYLHLDHNYRHDPNAILAFVLTAFIVYALLSAFYCFNLKPDVRAACCLSTLIRVFWLTLEALVNASPIRNPP
jgi:hypothetical protein